MAVINPPFALQNAGATHTAAGDRMMVSGLIAGQRASGSQLTARGGVSLTAGSELITTATGTPSMAVQVFSGMCYIPGTEATAQGVYACINDSAVTIPITTAHGTLPRVDSVIGRVYDSLYSGATNAWALEVIDGTPASSPVPPTLPNNSIRLFNVNVGAAVTSITNGNILDVREWMVATGGIIPIRNQTERDALTAVVSASQFAFRTDNGNVEVLWNGQWWVRSPQPIISQNYLSQPAYAVTGVWVDFPGGNWPAITFTAPRSGNFTVSIGGQLNSGPTHSIWLGYRVSGGLTVASTSANAIGIVASTASMSKEFFFSGATPGASVTVTPQYQIQSSSTGHSITNGQMRVRLEA